MTDKKISKDQVKHIGKLAWIGLSSKDIEKFRSQLSDILEYVDLLKKIDTKNIFPTFQVTDQKNVWRRDSIKPSLTQKEALQNAPEQEDGFFKVKKVL